MRTLALTALLTAGLMAPAASLAQTARVAGASGRVAGPADEARAHLLEDGGPTHHHALHMLNPLVARYKRFYPNRVHLTVDDTGEEFTILNEGPRFQVAAGLYGKADLVYLIPNEEIEKIYEKVQGGMPGEGMPRLELAGLMREWVELSLDLPDPADAVDPPGPPVRKVDRPWIKLVKLTDSLLVNTGKAGEAKAAGKKLATLFYGLKAKVALFRQGKLAEKLVDKLVGELGRDLDEGRMEITPGGYWSSFVDVFSFYMVIRTPAASGFTGVLTPLKQRVQGLLSYQKTLPETQDLATRDEILQARLALLEKMVDVNDL